MRLPIKEAGATVKVDPLFLKIFMRFISSAVSEPDFLYFLKPLLH